MELSRILSDEEFSPQFNDWIKICPDPNMLRKALEMFSENTKHQQWLEEFQPCSQCGEASSRRQLRWDKTHLFGADDELTCARCWKLHREAVCGDPGPWPEELPLPPNENSYLKEAPRNIIDEEGKIIGIVDRYESKWHTGVVTLFGFDIKEAGCLHPDWRVI